MALSFNMGPQAEPSWKPLVAAIDGMTGAVVAAADMLADAVRMIPASVGAAFPASVMLAGVALAAPAQPTVPASQPPVVQVINSAASPVAAPVTAPTPTLNVPALAQPTVNNTIAAPQVMVGPLVTPQQLFLVPVTPPQPVPLPGAQQPVIEITPHPAYVAPLSQEVQPVEPTPQVQPRNFLSRWQSDLLAGARSRDGADRVHTDADGTQKIQRLLETTIAEIRSLADRPIDVSVTTRLDGRQIAQSVYKDLRERKVRNYETL